MPQFQTPEGLVHKTEVASFTLCSWELNLRFVHSSSRGQCNLAVDFGSKQIWAHHLKWSKVKVLVTQLCLTFCDRWTVAHQTPLPMGFSRREYWSGLPCPTPGDLPDPGLDPSSVALQEDSLPLSHWVSPQICLYVVYNTICMLVRVFVYVRDTEKKF